MRTRTKEIGEGEIALWVLPNVAKACFVFSVTIHLAILSLILH